MTQQKFKVGDTVLVSVKNRVEESRPYTVEYEIQQITRRFIIANTVGHYDYRKFDKATLVHKPKNSKYEWRIWNNQEEYDEAVAAGYYKKVSHAV